MSDTSSLIKISAAAYRMDLEFVVPLLSGRYRVMCTFKSVAKTRVLFMKMTRFCLQCFTQFRFQVFRYLWIISRSSSWLTHSIGMSEAIYLLVIVYCEN